MTRFDRRARRRAVGPGAGMRMLLAARLLGGVLLLAMLAAQAAALAVR